MSTKEQIIIARKESTVPRYRTIAANRGTYYRSPAEQLRDTQDLQQAIAEARHTRLRGTSV